MPTVPGIVTQQLAAEEDKRPTPERLLMTAADMHARGQLTSTPSSYGQPGADLKLPYAGGGRGTRPERSKGKRK
jgi:hypothetical protein